jgi:hypothetical protein
LAKKVRETAIRSTIRLARFMQCCSPELGRTLMQVDLFLVWVALLGALSFLALSVAD